MNRNLKICFCPFPVAPPRWHQKSPGLCQTGSTHHLGIGDPFENLINTINLFLQPEKSTRVISECPLTTTSLPLPIFFLEPWQQTEYAGSLPHHLSLSENNIEEPSIRAIRSYPFPSWQRKLRAARPIVRMHKGRTENWSFSHPMHQSSQLSLWLSSCIT